MESGDFFLSYVLVAGRSGCDDVSQLLRLVPSVNNGWFC